MNKSRRPGLKEELKTVNKTDFGKDFIWGASSSAFQTEGAWNAYHKSASIWDTFTDRKGKIKGGDHAREATNFYKYYNKDLDLLSSMNFNAFRFSVAWSRILPKGIGKINMHGIDYYKRVIDSCLDRGIEPWLTLYHWDLPQILEDKGGWMNRDVISWFEEYTAAVTVHFKDRVKHWMILNEPLSFTAMGYLLGKHAPGKRGLSKFFPAMHHATLCQSAGARIVRSEVPDAQVGTTFNCSVIEPYRNREKDHIVAKKIDAAFNRLFLEPALGMGYPLSELPELKKLEKHILAGDENRLAFDFDFIGIQYYFRLVVAHSWRPPLLMQEISATNRNVKLSTMNYEINSLGFYRALKRFAAYEQIKKIIITEAGICIPDKISAKGRIKDKRRINYYRRLLYYLKKAKEENMPIDGFFAWSLTDNFEWSEGYHPRFGLIYVDYSDQKRIVKDSGKWFRKFLAD